MADLKFITSLYRGRFLVREALNCIMIDQKNGNLWEGYSQ